MRIPFTLQETAVMPTGALVAKKKVGPGRPVKAGDGGPDFVRVRVSAAYKEWLMRFAERERSDMSDLIDDALEAYASAKGMEAPPKR